jgi:hypothetical protein
LECFSFVSANIQTSRSPIEVEEQKMNTKIILAVIGVALVAAALVGVSAAQYVGAQNRINTAQNQLVPPCADATGALPEYCVNATTGEPYCYSNQTRDGYCQNSTSGVGGYGQGEGCYGYGYGNGCGAQAQNQYGYGYGAGMMGQTGYGRGHCR